MDFYKYQAAGNDFVLVTSLESRADISADEVIRLCDRRYGIGADGLIIMESSTHINTGEGMIDSVWGR